MNVIAVFIGGGMGSLIRYGIYETTRRYIPISFPVATLISNIASALLVGCIMGMALNTAKVNETVRLFLVTGFCGGFSTFSAFSFETFNLLRTGNTIMAMANIIFSVATCLLFVWLGWKLAGNNH